MYIEIGKINRTHWAIKEGDLFKILKLDVDTNNSRYIDSFPKLKETNSKVSSVTGFIQKVFDINKSRDIETYYIRSCLLVTQLILQKISIHLIN